MAYGKLIGAKMFNAPNVLNKDGKQYINPPEELYLEYGYLPLEYTTIPDMKDGYHLVQSWITMENKLVQIWNYERDDDSTETLTQKIKQLEEQINILKNPLIGTIYNPISYIVGMEVEYDNYYTNGIKTVRAIAGGTPAELNDINYFDI